VRVAGLEKKPIFRRWRLVRRGIDVWLPTANRNVVLRIIMQQPKTESVGALLVDGLGVAGEEVEIETKRE
jgi:hypothetical protein